MSPRAFAGRIVRALPERLMDRLMPGRLGYRLADIPAPPVWDDAPVRLLVAPANFAGQGYAWARAAQAHLDVSARNATVVREGRDWGFASDVRVPSAVQAHSRLWSTALIAAVRAQATHVLVEAERGILGRAFQADPRREADWFEAQGIERAYLSHGSDIRLPSRHAALGELSPFRDDDPRIAELESLATRNGEFLAEQTLRPVFVSTPDLLIDVPHATWLPLVVDVDRWSSHRVPMARARPIVVHAPTNTWLKGTQLVDDVLRSLHESQVIDYRPIRNVPSRAMAQVYAEADIVLDQFRIGNYGAVAIEAMASGATVVSHVTDQVRGVVSAQTGSELPIVEAVPATVEEVLREVVADRAAAQERAQAGVAFAQQVHGGAFSARTLATFLQPPEVRPQGGAPVG